MDKVINLIQKVFMFEAKPQKIGLTQLKKVSGTNVVKPSIKNKEVKLSDLMRHSA